MVRLSQARLRFLVRDVEVVRGVVSEEVAAIFTASVKFFPLSKKKKEEKNSTQIQVKDI